jgi:hypothetical protein
MPMADDYRIKATDMSARAKREQDILIRAEYESLALAYFRLADQAEKNAETDIVYEIPAPRLQPQHQQQQQQAQPTTQDEPKK